MKAVWTLIQKDFLLELRQKHIVMGLMLYVLSTVFAVYLMSGRPDGKTWNALFWIVQLFVCVNAVAKSFLQEAHARFRYFYFLVRPQHFIIAKIIYSMVLQIFLCAISWLMFTLLLGTPVMEMKGFILITFLGSSALATVFTFLSAVAAVAQQNSGVVAILGFPLVFPLLLILNKLATAKISGVVINNEAGLMWVLLLLIFLVMVLAYILYPVLWKE